MKLTIENFRCIENYEVEFENDEFLLVEGPNGRGKSSIFMAILFLISKDYSTGKGEKFSRIDPGRQTPHTLCVSISDNGFTYSRKKGKNKVTVTTPKGELLVGDEAEACIAERFGNPNVSREFYLDNVSMSVFFAMSKSDRYRQFLRVFDIEAYQTYIEKAIKHLKELKVSKKTLGEVLSSQEVVEPQIRRFSDDELKNIMSGMSLSEFIERENRKRELDHELKMYTNSEITEEDVDQAREFSEISSRLLELRRVQNPTISYQPIEIRDRKKQMRDYTERQTLLQKYNKDAHNAVRHVTPEKVQSARNYRDRMKLHAKLEDHRPISEIDEDISMKEIQARNDEMKKRHIHSSEILDSLPDFSEDDIALAEKTREKNHLLDQLSKLNPPSDDELERDEILEKELKIYLENLEKYTLQQKLLQQIQDLPEDHDEALLSNLLRAQDGRYISCPSCKTHLILVQNELIEGKHYDASILRQQIRELRSRKIGVEKRKKLEKQLGELIEKPVPATKNKYTSQQRKKYRAQNEEKRRLLKNLEKYDDLIDVPEDPKKIRDIVWKRKKAKADLEQLKNDGYPLSYRLVKKSLTDLKKERDHAKRMEMYQSQIDEIPESTLDEDPDLLEKQLQQKKTYDEIEERLSELLSISEDEYNYLLHFHEIQAYEQAQENLQKLEKRLQSLTSPHREKKWHLLEKQLMETKKYRATLQERESYGETISSDLVQEIQIFFRNKNLIEAYDRQITQLQENQKKMENLETAIKNFTELIKYITRKKNEKLQISIEGVNSYLRENMSELLKDSVQLKVEISDEKMNLSASKDGLSRDVGTFSDGEKSCMYTVYMMSLYMSSACNIFISDENLSVLDDENKSIMFEKLSRFPGVKIIVSHGSPQENARVLTI